MVIAKIRLTPQVKKQVDHLKEKLHQVGYIVEVDSVSEEPDASCEAIFDDAFEQAFDTALAAEGDQMRDVTVKGSHPEAAAKSLAFTGAYSYVYFEYGAILPSLFSKSYYYQECSLKQSEL